MQKYKSLECFLDYVLIFKDEQQRKSAESELDIPDLVQDLPLVGTVMHAGPGYFDFEDGHWVPQLAKIGDHVVFNRYAGYKTVIDDAEFVMLQGKDLIGGDCEEGIYFHHVERAREVNNIQYDHGKSKYRQDEWR